ncbi:MAG: AsnC family protein [Rhodospirillales bacterium]|nr:AsnC family protein [Rhodospirillales bacterium]
MPQKRQWTDAQDSQIRRLRAEGAGWEMIAAILGISRFAVMDRGRSLGARKPVETPAPVAEDPQREPLPAGHPRSWGALTDGTVLAGEAYPLPVFLR